ncbi:hypothetical protein [Acetobacter sicerae]|uniref:hypothetical protein n=1 Tax=Acetobacter sicerae TaxID=85325 RepID=UPI00156B3E55|nr:hypothetical protein [Acetobacter sicerae]NHN93882.1 hypothetical protein [Acetobacter sicerae]
MSSTPEMIEAAARAICTRQGFKPDMICALTGVPQWKTFTRDAEEAIKAALAAMWLPFPQKSPPHHCDVMVKTWDGIVMNDELTEDGWMIASDDDVVAFASIAIFEDRK